MFNGMGGQLSLAPGIDEVDADDQPVGVALYAASEHQDGAECVPRLPRAVHMLAQDVAGGDDAHRSLELLELCQLIGKDLHQTRAQRVVSGRAEVMKRKHGDELLRHGWRRMEG